MRTLILLISLTLSTGSFAGPGGGHSHGHDHSAPKISKEKTEQLGRSHIERLIKAEKLNISWKNSTFDKSKKKNFKGRTEWVVTFNNKKGIKGKKLYIFLELSGEFVAANFTGK